MKTDGRCPEGRSSHHPSRPVQRVYRMQVDVVMHPECRSDEQYRITNGERSDNVPDTALQSPIDAQRI